MGGLQTKEGQPSWQEGGGRCVLGHSSQRKTDRARAGQLGVGMPGRQAPRNMVATDGAGHRSQNEPEAAREKPGCDRGLMTRWQVRLADWGQAGLPGTGARNREGISPGTVARSGGSWQGPEDRGREVGGGLSTGCAVRMPRGQVGKYVCVVGARLDAGWFRGKESHPPPPRKEEEAGSCRLSKRQQIQQLGHLQSVSRKFLGLLSLRAQEQILEP